MPELKAEIGELKNAPFTAVGFNVDADKERGRILAAQHELAWAQNYLGEKSDFAKQLAVSSVPAYYLIGSSSDWKEIRRLLKEKLVVNR